MNAVNEGRQRQNIKRVASESVQGEGSWVEVRGMTLGESKRITAEQAALEGNQTAQLELTEQLIRAHVLNWSWVDDEGEPLSTPDAEPAVLDKLTVEEITFLGRAITGQTDPK